MNDETKITCILCPIGCEIRINKKNLFIIEGAKCEKGIEYSKNEVLDPKRILTSSILIKNGILPLISVKTNKPIPKDKLFNILEILKKTSVNAPVEMGEKIIINILNTGSDIIATKTVKKSK